MSDEAEAQARQPDSRSADSEVGNSFVGGKPSHKYRESVFKSVAFRKPRRGRSRHAEWEQAPVRRGAERERGDSPTPDGRGRSGEKERDGARARSWKWPGLAAALIAMLCTVGLDPRSLGQLVVKDGIRAGVNHVIHAAVEEIRSVGLGHDPELESPQTKMLKYAQASAAASRSTEAIQNVRITGFDQYHTNVVVRVVRICAYACQLGALRAQFRDHV